ncbi:MAG: hypothetical protein QGH60_02230 [Phycisphaerae bacterium]|nr:hypothetical protein [Phycisphaerae bacterium]
MPATHYLTRHLNIAALLIALVLVSGGCSEEAMMGGGIYIGEMPPSNPKASNDTPPPQKLPPVPPDMDSDNIPPSSDERAVARQSISGDWWDAKGTYPVLRFTLDRGWYRGVLLRLPPNTSFKKGEAVYRIERVSRWVFEGKVLTKYSDGREPHWKKQIRFIISSDNPSVMKGYGQFGNKTDVATYTRPTR